jgi:hypothetical protein
VTVQVNEDGTLPSTESSAGASSEASVAPSTG